MYRDYEDMNYERGDRNEREDYGYEPRRISGYYGRKPFEMTSDYARSRMRDYARRDYARRRDYNYDYAMDDKEIREWTKYLMSQMEDREKEFFTRDRVIKRAEALGVRFDEFTEEELYATILMLYTDFKKIVGSSSVDSYINMAKEWLKDPDSAVKNSEKLALYYDHIILGE